MNKKKGYRFWSLLLIFMLMLGVIATGQIPAYAMEEIKFQNLPAGTEESSLNLMGVLTNTGSPGSGEQETGREEDTIDADDSAAGAINLVEGSELEPPTVTMAVYEEKPLGIITDFIGLDEDIRWQNTPVPIFPEKVTGTVDGKTMLIPVTWEADHPYDTGSPESGLYIFTAEAGEGYLVADGVELPRITVYVPQLQKMMLRMTSTAPNAHIVITTAAQLEEIAVLVNQGRLESFILNDSETSVILQLGNDLDLSAYGANWNGGKGWIPIGASKPFKSHFDGNGRTITGLYINDSTLNCAGLFGNLSDNGVVSGLTLTSVNINAGMFVGSIAGNVASGKIQDCHVSGMVKGTVFVGGIAGQTFSFITGNNTIVRCASDIAVNGEFWVGGIVGGMLGDIETESLVQNCYAAGSVSGFSAIGGVAGSVGQGCMISNCYATGSVTAENIAGGIAGLNYGTIQDSVALNPSIDLSNTSGETDCGRIAGENDTGILLNNTAYHKMFININGTRRGSTSDAAGIDGADLALAEINADGSIGGRFIADAGWVVEKGKLPGFGTTVEIPAYINDINDHYFRGSGTENDPFLIETAEQLKTLAELVNSSLTNANYGGQGVHYKLDNDIDLSGYGAGNSEFNGGKGWVPIGTYYYQFSGTFDGNGKAITGLYINDINRTVAGLFGYIYRAVIRNVILENVDVTARQQVGGLVGEIISGNVDSCYVSGVVKGYKSVGGIAGTGSGLPLKITRSVSAVIVIGTAITESGVIISAQQIGGLVGFVNGTIEDCYSTGQVNGDDTSISVGGLAGYAIGTISNCYSTGDINGQTNVGGLFGETSDITITSCIALNEVVSGNTNVRRMGGLSDSSVSISDCYVFDGMKDGSGKTLADGGFTSADNGCTDIGADQLMFAVNLPEAFHGAPWTVADGYLPGLFGELLEMPDHIKNELTGGGSFAGGRGTQSNPYLIATAEQLAYLAQQVNDPATNDEYGGINAHYKLINDIDLSAYGPENTGFNGGKGWVPIGKENVPFCGTFNGNGMTITGLYINDNNLDNAGLFGYTRSTVIANARLKEVNITADISVGCLVGYIRNGTVDSCYVSGTVTGNIGVGGLAGRIFRESSATAKIMKSVSAADVTGRTYQGTEAFEIGGLIGTVVNATISDCYSSGRVIGINSDNHIYSGVAIGGLVGDMTYGILNSCYTISEVCGNNDVGGLVGHVMSNSGPELYSSMALNPVIRGNDTVRIISPEYYILSDCYAFAGMKDGSGKTLADGVFSGLENVNTDITADELMLAANLPGAFRQSPWTVANGYLPGLFGELVEMPAHILAEVKNTIFTGSGDENDPWQISTPEQLAMLAQLANMGNTNLNNKDQYYILVNDINLSGYDSSNTGFNGGKGWVPIGTTTNPFKGHFSGEGHTITGLYINSNAEESAGLFGVIDTDASVANLGITNASIRGGRYVGGIAGVLSGMAENCFVTGNLSGTEYVGGIAGTVSNTGKVQNCYSNGSITGTPYAGSGLQYVGGITGAVENTAWLQNCYSTASVAGIQYVGGIAGAVLNSGRIADCAALNPSISGVDTGRVTGSTDTGGTLAGNYAFSNMTGGGRNRSADGTDGADASPTAVKNTTFWTTGERWDTGAWDASAWSFENDRLPILKGFADGIQSGDSGLYLMAKDIAYATVDTGGPYTYNGSPIIIGMAVAFDGQTLEVGKDYSFGIIDAKSNSVSEVIDAGTYHVTLTGINRFTGMAEIPVNVEPKDLPTEDNITVNDSSFTYSGTAHEPEVTVTDGSRTLIKNVDYTLSYVNNTNVGTATVIVTGKGNYKTTSTRQVTFTIVAGNLPSEENIRIIGGPFTYNGTAHEPEVTVTDGSRTLINNVDYTLSYVNNTNVGMATVIVTGKGNYKTTNTRQVTFTIVAGNLPSEENIRIIGGPFTYNGTAHEPEVTVTDGSRMLIKNVDYTLSYENNIDVGTATVVVTGKGNYTDVRRVTFTIEPKNLPTEDNITVTGAPFTYSGTAHEPEVTVKDGDKTLAKDIDYTLSYENNTNAGTATVIVTGQGHYQGIRNVPFTIGKLPVTVKADDKTMTRDDQLPTFTCTVEGQLSGETALVGIPVLTCAGDGSSAGLYPIKVDLTGVSYTPNYTAADPAFINGTLTVNPIPNLPFYKVNVEKAKTPIIEITVSGNIVTGATTVSSEINNAGNATATIDLTQAGEVVRKTTEAAEMMGEGDITRIVFNVEVPDNVATVETIIPEDAVSQASESGISALAISTPVATITFSADTFSILSEEAEGPIKVTASRVEHSALSPETQKLAGNRPVYAFSVTSGNKVISKFGGDVTVSVPYTPEEGEDINAIVIYYINAEGELEIVRNCVYDPSTGTIRFTTNHFSLYMVGYNKVDFKDVPTSAWYSDAVTFIAARDITAGTGGGNFSPEATLTRGQFIVMLMRAYEITPDTDIEANFADVGDTWYTGYLAAAKRLGISNGIGNNMFGPDREITRQEVFTLLYNALKIIGRLPEGTEGKTLSSFADAAGVADWAREAITVLVETGIVRGDGSRLNPTRTMTRGEMAQLLYNLLSR